MSDPEFDDLHPRGDNPANIGQFSVRNHSDDPSIHLANPTQEPIDFAGISWRYLNAAMSANDVYEHHLIDTQRAQMGEELAKVTEAHPEVTWVRFAVEHDEEGAYLTTATGYTKDDAEVELEDQPEPWKNNLDDIELAFEACNYAVVNSDSWVGFEPIRAASEGHRHAAGRSLDDLQRESLRLEGEFHHIDDLAGGAAMAGQVIDIRKNHPEADHVELLMEPYLNGMRLSGESRVYDADGNRVPTGDTEYPYSWSNNPVTVADLWCHTGAYPYDSGEIDWQGRRLTLRIDDVIEQATDMIARDAAR